MVSPNDITRERAYLSRECKERYIAGSCSSSVAENKRNTDALKSEAKVTKERCSKSNDSKLSSKKKRIHSVNSQKSIVNASKRQKVSETRSQTKETKKLSNSRARNSSTGRKLSASERDLGSFEDSWKRWNIISKKFMDIL